MGRRSSELELAVLGLLQQRPMHGYELRKQLRVVLGPLRTLSYGTLYPRLRELLESGDIVECSDGGGTSPGSAARADCTDGTSRHESATGETGTDDAPAASARGPRARIVYRITEAGTERFRQHLAQPGPTAWEDGAFDVHFAFFAHTEPESRLRILEGRRARLEERLASARALAEQPCTGYTTELHRHSIECAERDLRWVTEQIERERAGPT